MWFCWLWLVLFRVLAEEKVVIANVVQVRVLTDDSGEMLQRQLDSLSQFPFTVLTNLHAVLAYHVVVATPVTGELFDQHRDFPGGFTLYVLRRGEVVGTSTLARFGWVGSNDRLAETIHQSMSELLVTNLSSAINANWRGVAMQDLNDSLRRASEAHTIAHAKRAAWFIGSHERELALKLMLVCQQSLLVDPPSFIQTSTNPQPGFALVSFACLVAMVYMVYDAKTCHKFHSLTTTVSNKEFCKPASRRRRRRN
ncbi:hypothetical protein BASA81_006205 [Batrachochytrium salamandrivorans]|nr:hypothetical protein BASA81_006205 [Batrachochytrium salamandrivorans]